MIDNSSEQPARSDGRQARVPRRHEGQARRGLRVPPWLAQPDNVWKWVVPDTRDPRRSGVAPMAPSAALPGARLRAGLSSRGVARSLPSRSFPHRPLPARFLRPSRPSPSRRHGPSLLHPVHHLLGRHPHGGQARCVVVRRALLPPSVFFRRKGQDGSKPG